MASHKIAHIPIKSVNPPDEWSLEPAEDSFSIITEEIIMALRDRGMAAE